MVTQQLSSAAHNGQTLVSGAMAQRLMGRSEACGYPHILCLGYYRLAWAREPLLVAQLDPPLWDRLQVPCSFPHHLEGIDKVTVSVPSHTRRPWHFRPMVGGFGFGLSAAHVLQLPQVDKPLGLNLIPPPSLNIAMGSSAPSAAHPVTVVAMHCACLGLHSGKVPDAIPGVIRKLVESMSQARSTALTCCPHCHEGYGAGRGTNRRECEARRMGRRKGAGG